MVRTHKDILQMWPSLAELARDIKQKPETVRKWPQRNRIPADHWPAVVEAASRRGIHVSLEDLVRTTRQ